MVVGPATYDTMTGAFGRYHFTWVPVAITLAATAAVPLLLMLLFRVVPLLSIDEIDEIDEANEIQKMEKHLTERPHAAPPEPAGHDGNLVGATGTSHRVAGTTGVLLLVAILGIFGVGMANPAQAATAPRTSTSALVSTADQCVVECVDKCHPECAQDHDHRRQRRGG